MDFFGGSAGGGNSKNEKCRCSNSKCLKLYCVCFSSGVFCSEGCKCSGCNNREGCEKEVKSARKATLIRNPNAFTSKVEVVATHENEDPMEDFKHAAMLGYKKGCKCKRTNCRKKYCECYNAGVKCSYLCVCEDCQNKEEPTNGVAGLDEDPGKKKVKNKLLSTDGSTDKRRLHPRI